MNDWRKVSALKRLGHRVAVSALTLVGVLMLVFVIARVLPGDPARLQAGPYATDAELESIRAEMGLNDALPTQLLQFLGDVVRLDLGTSTRTSRPVVEELFDRIPATLELSLGALAAATLLGVLLGIAAAFREGAVVDHLVRSAIVVGTSMPVFWVGMILLFIFFSTLGWAPPPLGRLPVLANPPTSITGLYTLDSALTLNWKAFWQAIASLWLPVSALALVVFAPIANVTRTALIRELGSDYIRTQRSLGLPVGRDALRTALPPIITTIGVVLGYLIGGNVLIESLFAWPGIGQYAWQALANRDIPALQGVVLLVGAFYIAMNVLIEITYVASDPRVRSQA